MTSLKKLRTLFSKMRKFRPFEIKTTVSALSLSPIVELPVTSTNAQK